MCGCRANLKGQVTEWNAFNNGICDHLRAQGVNSANELVGQLLPVTRMEWWI